MKRISLILLLFASLIILQSVTKARANGEWQFIVCNTCNNSIAFENTAKGAFPGNVTVYNFSASTARSYEVIHTYGEVFGPGTAEVTVSEITNPSEVQEALDLYDDLNTIFETYPITPSSSSFNGNDSSLEMLNGYKNDFGLDSFSSIGPFGGICGPESNQALATKIPDGVFAAACQGHDQCYATGNFSKSYCDASFRQELRLSARDAASRLNGGHNRFAALLVLDIAGTIYADFVETSRSAYDAYCSSANNSAEDYCVIGFDQARVGGQRVTESSTIIDTNGMGTGFRIQLRCVQTSITASNGLRWTQQLCFNTYEP